jgi:copper chaperone CopZ
MEQRWSVKGLTCGHCVGSVTAELMKIKGVEKVEIVLNANETSIVTTEGEQLTADQITSALNEAGEYLLA